MVQGLGLRGDTRLFLPAVSSKERVGDDPDLYLPNPLCMYVCAFQKLNKRA